MSHMLEITVRNKVGLHARPATLFVKEASQHASAIHVENLTNPSPAVDARSLFMVLSIGVESGHTMRITADGVDETVALERLKNLIENNFGEE